MQYACGFERDIASAGDSVGILSAETPIGEFDVLTLALPDGGLSWNIDYIRDEPGIDPVRPSVINTIAKANAILLLGCALLSLIGIARGH